MTKQTCAECRRDYALAPDERRLRGEAAEILCPGCQVAAAHDAWAPAAPPTHPHIPAMRGLVTRPPTAPIGVGCATPVPEEALPGARAATT